MIWRTSSRGLGWRWVLVVVVLVLGVVVPSSALALSQRGHVFGFSFGLAGKGEGQFSDPSGVGVEDSTGEVFVADHKNKRLVRLEPVFNEDGELVGESYAGASTVPSPSSVAVDDSSEGVDPSRGDVYVVGSGGKAVYKLGPAGEAIGGPLKKFTVPGTGVKTKFEAIEGIAVDGAGRLFVYEEDGEVYVFSDAVSNGYLFEYRDGLGRAGRAGLRCGFRG